MVTVDYGQQHQFQARAVMVTIRRNGVFSGIFSAKNSVSAYNGQFVTNGALTILAPFTPTRLAVQKMVYAANDPFVHYLTSDLNDFADDTNSRVLESLPA